MTGRTSHYGLDTVGQGDTFSAHGYKFGTTDRETVDFLLARGAELHRHDGQTIGVEAPTAGLSLDLSSSGGTLPPSTRIYYKFTWVTNDGQESMAGPEAWIDTPPAVTRPSPPVLTPASTGGTLLPGVYYYVVSAYVTSSTLETLASDPAFVNLVGPTGENMVTLTMPTLPPGATGFNIYCRKPGQSKYFYIDSTTDTTWVDTGSVAQDCDRSNPSRNATNTSNKVIVSLPGATPAVPEGVTWKIYRTYAPGNYTRSLLHHVVEALEENRPTITPTYTDIGLPTTNGAPPSTTLTVTNPRPIDLTLETVGNLDASKVTGLPIVAVFSMPGLAQVDCAAVWVNTVESPVHLRRIALALGPDRFPAADDLIVDVLYGDGSWNPVYTDLFAAIPDQRPQITSGYARGQSVDLEVLDVTVGGDEVVAVRVAQAGGGATPNDYDLTITLTAVTVPPPP